MRKTKEELLFNNPCWNIEKHDIVKVMYGDIPLFKVDGNNKYEDSVKMYIWRNYGDFYVYRTLRGEIGIKGFDTILYGSHNVTYRGITYSLDLNLMYGLKSLDILKLSGEKVKGFSNKDGIGSPSNKLRTEELDEETIYKILNCKDIEDYGVSVKCFMEKCKQIYELDKENYIMKKCFNLRS